MPAGYSPNPLYKKLGLKEGARLAPVHPPDNYAALLDGFLDRVSVQAANAGELDVVHLFTNDAAELEMLLPRLREQIKKNGAIWVSWYKKSAAKPTTLNENLVRGMALAAGLVDVKVCAVDESWSGLKLVIRLKDR